MSLNSPKTEPQLSITAAEEASVQETKSNNNAGSVDQIRDILFGKQMDEYQDRFAALENKLVMENNSLREGLEKRIDSALAELEEERTSRKSAFNELMTDLSNRHEQIEAARLSTEHQLLEQLDTARNQIEDQMHTSSASENKRHDRIKSLFRDLADKLENDSD